MGYGSIIEARGIVIRHGTIITPIKNANGPNGFNWKSNGK
jgi:hypothetical protein